VVLKGNTEISENVAAKSGGGVSVAGKSRLILEVDSKITNNQVTAGNSGGVAVTDESVLIMQGGEITNNHINTSGTGGGGVSLFGYSTFTMQGGRIAENTTPTYGGGTMIMIGSFIMEGGVIEKNSAARGGGIYIYNTEIHAPFTMTGGTVYGSDNAENANTATAANGGHVLYDARSPVSWIDTTITGYPPQ
jgi:hypothetical protein